MKKKAKRRVGRPRVEESYELKQSINYIECDTRNGWESVMDKKGTIPGCHMKKNHI